MLKSSRRRWSALPGVLLLILCGCPGPGQTTLDPHPKAVMTARQQAEARPALLALQDSRFDEAQQLAEKLLVADPRNPQGRLIQALLRYKRAGHQLALDVGVVLDSAERRGLNHAYMRQALGQASQALQDVDRDLEVAARAGDVSLELCLACLRADWNMNGRIDRRDERLFEIEIDADGAELPADDPRRRPTFRFDLGDVYWARALLSFQQALLEVLLAYRFTDLGEDLEAIARRLFKGGGRLTIHLQEPARIARARGLILAGLDHAERSRRLYLAETDDDREWVPSPRQKNHPLPLPVDEALYETWAGVIGDLRGLVRSEAGLSVAEIAQLGDHQFPAGAVPGGFLDLGALLSQPRDLVIEISALDHAHDRPEQALRSLFGAAYVDQLRPSPLVQRLLRMKGEVKRGHESLERKLRYLFWLN